MKRIFAFACAALLGSASTAALAEELSVVGSWSSLPLHKQYEQPFWSKTLPEASGSSLTTKLTTHDQMGIGVGDVFRMLGDGVFDVAMTVGDYAVSDAPALEGLDVPLIATDADSAKAMVNAARPLVEKIFEDKFKSKVLAIAPYPPQIVFCNAEIKSLDDLKGKKIRGSGRMTTKFLEALGAEGVNISFGEVPGALQRGVIDCAITGAGSGYNAGWWEVTTHLLTLPLGGWDPVVTAINLEKWAKLSKEQQDLIQKEIVENFEKPAWAAAQDALKNDVACLTGNGDCPAGEKRSLKLVEATEADTAKAREILVSTVLPDWASRAGKEAAQEWNESVGKVTGVTIPLN